MNQNFSFLLSTYWWRCVMNIIFWWLQYKARFLMFHCGLTVWRLSTWSDETLPNEKSMKHKVMKLSGTRSVHVKKVLREKRLTSHGLHKRRSERFQLYVARVQSVWVLQACSSVSSQNCEELSVVSTDDEKGVRNDKLVPSIHSWRAQHAPCSTWLEDGLKQVLFWRRNLQFLPSSDPQYR